MQRRHITAFIEHVSVCKRTTRTDRFRPLTCRAVADGPNADSPPSRRQLNRFNSSTPRSPPPHTAEHQAFTTNLCRLIRSRAFIQQVVKLLKWPYIRFTGVVFQRCKVNNDTPDGIPAHLSQWQNKADVVVVDLPAGMISKALKLAAARPGRSNGQVPLNKPQTPSWCALFEVYGESSELAQIDQNILTNFNEDIDTQLISWSNRRLSMRTETDLNDPTGPELFHEDYLSYID